MPTGSFAIRECDRYRAMTDADRITVATREFSFAFTTEPPGKMPELETEPPRKMSELRSIEARCQ
jgi:hypothetical protein